MNDDAYREAKGYAIRCLALRAHASAELAAKLRRRQIPDTLVHALLKELTQDGYLDDKAWVEGFIQRESGKRHGVMVISQKLKAKGIKNIPVLNPEEELEPLLTWLKRQPAPEDRRKLIAKLARRGYRLETIFEAFRRLAINLEEEYNES